MSATILVSTDPVSGHPIDQAEEIVAGNDWAFERHGVDELACEVPGRYCDFRLFFAWRPQVAAIHLACMIDLRVDERKRQRVHHLHGLMNEKLWIGHFELCSDHGAPMWRHTLLHRGLRDDLAMDQLEEAVETALNECERLYPAYQFLLWGGKTPEEAFEAAMFDCAGEA